MVQCKEDEAINRHKLKYRKFHLNIRKNFVTLHAWTLEEVSQRGCGGSVLGVTQNLIGQPWAICCRWPCSEWAVGLHYLQRGLLTSAILWYLWSRTVAPSWVFAQILRDGLAFFFAVDPHLLPCKAAGEQNWWRHGEPGKRAHYDSWYIQVWTTGATKFMMYENDPINTQCGDQTVLGQLLLTKVCIIFDIWEHE